MNWIDWVAGAILLIGLVRGYLNGFVFEVAHLGAYFLGLYAGFRLADSAAAPIARLLDASPGHVSMIAFTVVFLLVWTGVLLLGKLFDGLVKVAFLGLFNSIAGAVFGCCKYAVLLGIFIYLFHKADASMKLISPDTKASSVLYYPLGAIGPKLLPMLSPEDS